MLVTDKMASERAWWEDVDVTDGGGSGKKTKTHLNTKPDIKNHFQIHTYNHTQKSPGHSPHSH